MVKWKYIAIYTYGNNIGCFILSVIDERIARHFNQYIINGIRYTMSSYERDKLYEWIQPFIWSTYYIINPTTAE